MKIAFIGQNILPTQIQGAQKYVEEVSLRMAKMGHSVFVYGPKKNISQKIAKAKNIKFLFPENFFFKNFGEAMGILLASLHAIFANYDVVHYQSQKYFFLSRLIKKFKPQTKIVSSFDLVCEFKNEPRMSVQISKDVDEILKFKLRSKRFALFAQNLTKESGAHYLIEAFKYLEDTASTPNNFKLVLFEIGERDEEYVKFLHTISAKRSNIILIKSKSKKLFEQLFSHAYLFVQCSEVLQETSPILLTAMSYALAPVVSNIKENTEVVEDFGSIFVSKSANNLREVLGFLLSRPDEVEKMGKLAKEKIQKDYSWEAVTQKTLEAYALKNEQ